MWIFTNTGFVSAVSDRKNLVIRSRDRRSLEPIALACKGEIKHTPMSDYPYRVTATHQDFADWLSEMVQEIRYRNFKSEVSLERGDSFAKPLMRVWSVMHDVEDAESRVR